MKNSIDVRANHAVYEAASDANTPFAQLVDECFNAVRDVVKSKTNIFAGDDRAEELVAAIAHYLIRCEKP